MSMRATFTTSFIYDAAEGWRDRQSKLADIFGANKASTNIVGQLSGLTKGSSLSEEDIYGWVGEMCYEASKITIVPFTAVWIFEGGDILVKEINPYELIK